MGAPLDDACDNAAPRRGVATSAGSDSSKFRLVIKPLSPSGFCPAGCYFRSLPRAMVSSSSFLRCRFAIRGAVFSSMRTIGQPDSVVTSVGTPLAGIGEWLEPDILKVRIQASEPHVSSTCKMSRPAGGVGENVELVRAQRPGRSSTRDRGPLAEARGDATSESNGSSTIAEFKLSLAKLSI